MVQKERGKMFCKNFRFAFYALLSCVLAQPILAEEKASDLSKSIFRLGTLVVTAEGLDVADSPTPVDIVDEEEILKTGHNELGRVIQTLIPSFNFSSSTISDGTDSVRPATLRGMGPDQVLLLINGKRRHGSALIHVNTSVGRGTAGYDINAIPISAVKRIEVLRDGASALYGSDAIAGVINIILKDDYEGGAFTTSYGETYEGDGAHFITNLNKGFKIGDDGSLHVAVEFRDRQRTNRAGLMGDIQYPDTKTCKLGECPGGQLTNKEALLRQHSPNAVVILKDPENKERNINRNAFRIGDADSEQISGVFNFDKPIGSRSGLYSFGSFSRRENTSGGFYRRANQLDRNPEGSGYPDGFLPLIDTKVWDFSIGAGITHDFDNGLSTDLGVTHGGNVFNFKVKNSHNASWSYRKLNPQSFGKENDPFAQTDFTGATPTSADAGDLELYLTTVNLNFSMPLGETIELAWGGEYKRDNHKIKAGEPYSYADYDGITTGGGTGGIQVFPGFKPEDEVDESRHAFSVYSEASWTPYSRWLISPALRYERYSDFGNSLNGKISSKIDISEMLTLRGSVSSGFRAPSMQQLYFNNVSTQFNDQDGEQVAFEVGTFRNDSNIAKAIGIPELKEETSISWSGGFVFKPSPNFSVATDFYHVTVDDRIIISGQLERNGKGILTEVVQKALNAEGVGRAQFFMNAADTRTKGVDVVSSWNVPFVSRGALSLEFAGTISDTKITSVNLPAGLPGSLYTDQDRSILEDWQPDSHFRLSADYAIDRFAVWLALHRYGEYKVLDGQEQKYEAEFLTDVQLSCNLGWLGTVKVGANNLFDVKPDKNEIGQARGGKIIDTDGNVIVDSEGVFTYSRRSAPFGFNGGFYYLAYQRNL